MEDNYLTIGNTAEGLYKEKGSKFLGYSFPVNSNAAIKEALEKVKAIHPKARHFCYAFRLGLDKNNFRANDDGEPSGSAGKPILGQIDSLGLTNVFVVVVRYFGGTKLGVPGLINAYKEATKDALQNAGTIEKTVRDIYQIDFDYAIMSDVMNAIKRSEVEMIAQDFGIRPRISIAMPQSETEKSILQLKALIAKVSLDHAEVMGDIKGLEFNYERTQ